MSFLLEARLIPLLLLLSLSTVNTNENAKRLYDDLMINYNKLLRPTKNPRDVLTIKLRLRLSQIIDVHEKDQIMTSSIWLKQQWFDWKLAWNPRNYGGVSVLYVPYEMIWVPDIVLYNNADSNYNITISTKATLNHTGEVTWEPPAIFKSMCQIDVEWFPFDQQKCHLKFGSWTYTRDLLSLEFGDGEVRNWFDFEAFSSVQIMFISNLSDYYPSVEWDIMSRVAIRREKTYPSCCPGSEAYVDIIYYLVLRRKPLFYTVNLVFPCVGMSFLTILVFYLPSDSGEKITLCISILVSLTVFFLLLTEIIPATSIVLPLIGKYLLFTVVMVTLSVIVTVIVLNLHFRTPMTHRMPGWVKSLFLKTLPKYLFMRRPLDDAEESFRRVNARIKDRASKGGKIAINYHESRVSEDRLAVERHDAQRERIEQLYYSPQVLKAFENVCFIAEVLRKKHRDDKVDEDWKYVGMRFFACIGMVCRGKDLIWFNGIHCDF